ncbi:MAG: peptidylprolyl isomerase [Deltaproteobacteria bacterium]|nr:peptidylprolyl isomerase [Deltaproteobacteria bacterium]
MRIAKDAVVAIEYTIRDQEGEVVDSSEGRSPLVYIHGYRQIVPGVETALDGLEAGHGIDVHVSPAEGYGDRDPDAIMILPRSVFPEEEDLETGSMFRAFRSDGKPVVFSVLEATPEVVVVDANHPLAGQTLHVNVEVLSVRPATANELAHGHVHAEEPRPSPDVS